MDTGLNTWEAESRPFQRPQEKEFEQGKSEDKLEGDAWPCDHHESRATWNVLYDVLSHGMS